VLDLSAAELGGLLRPAVLSFAAAAGAFALLRGLL